MSKLHPYTAYKESGIGWLEQTPKHWNIKRFKHVFSLHKGKNLTKNPVVFSVTLSGIKVKDIHSNEGQLAASYDNYNAITPKNIVFNPMDLISGFVGRPETAGVVSPAYTSLKSSVKCNLDYFVYFIQKHYHERIFFPFGQGVSYEHRWTINNETFLNLPILFPSFEEQTAIANYLNRETAKLDTLIEKQQRLIELLKEKRQAVISKAVTKGLDDNVPMKDSGVEWLGEIPEHWKLSKIKYVTLKIVDTEHKTVAFYQDGTYLVARTSNVKDTKLILDKAKYTNEEGYINWTRRGKPQEGDILFTREAPAGEACLVPSAPTLCLGQRMVLFKIDKKVINPKFILYSIYGGLSDDFIKQLSQGSTVVHFNMADIKNIPLFEIPFNEQNIIVNFLDTQTIKIDTLIDKANQAIDLLKEKRKTLISAVVTGKIDVRGEVA